VTGRNHNASCSFCCKSVRDVGPLVEGPGNVYICGECVELCQSIIAQEKVRRGLSPSEESAAWSADQVFVFAQVDALARCGDLNAFRVMLALEADGWHIDYERKDPGRSPSKLHYVINAQSGKITAKRSED
jgi:hypothetical protein